MCAYVLSQLNHIQLLATPWAIAHQAPLSIWFSRQEYWSGFPCSSRRSSWPRDRSHASYIAGRFFNVEPQGKPCKAGYCLQCRRHKFNPWVGKIPCSRKWQPIPVFLPVKSHEQRSLVGYSSWSHKSRIWQRIKHHHHNILSSGIYLWMEIWFKSGKNQLM